MKVERVCTPALATIERGQSIREAARAMRRQHVGALLVRERGEGGVRVAGIVTDRDLVVLALAQPVDPDSATVDGVMSPVVASVRRDGDLLEALDLMRHAGVRRLLVTDARGEPWGLLSLDDAVDGLAAELASAAALMRTGIRREAEALAPAPPA
jgi:CBS domain-containing protein